MDRDEFMEIVYETFADEPDNVLANGIIEAADAYVEHEKAQLSKENTTSDLISRQAARHALCKAVHKGEDVPCENQTASCLWTGTRVCDFVREIDALPPVQPEPKEGEWEEIEVVEAYDIAGVKTWASKMMCNKCYFSTYAIEGRFGQYIFCPNCGNKNQITKITITNKGERT